MEEYDAATSRDLVVLARRTASGSTEQEHANVGHWFYNSELVTSQQSWHSRPEGRRQMKRYWISFWAVIIVSFMVLGWAGLQIYQERPPLPAAVVTPDGTVAIPGSGHYGGTERLAGDGRNGDRLCLGTWQLRGTGLDC